MRGLKDMGSAIQFTDGFLVYYNFFRPHEALKGKTPAEVAQIDYSVKNWADLSRLPVSKQAELHSHDIPQIITQQNDIPKNIKQMLGMGHNRILGADGMPRLNRRRGHWR
jgi:hypothetical protein